MTPRSIKLLLGATLMFWGCASHRPEAKPAQPPTGPAEAIDREDESPSPAALAEPIERPRNPLLDSCDACFPGSFTRPGVKEQACLEVVDYGPHEEDSEMSDPDTQEHKHTARLIIFDEKGDQVASAELDEWWSDGQSSKEWSLDGTYPLCGVSDNQTLVVHVFQEESDTCPEVPMESLAIFSFAGPENTARRIWEKSGSSVSPIEYGDGFLSISYLSSEAACSQSNKSLSKPGRIRLECRGGDLMEILR